MGEIRPLEEMADDVNPGDLVRVSLNYGKSNYIGYVWWCPKENGTTRQMTGPEMLYSKEIPAKGVVLTSDKDPNWIEDNKQRFMESFKGQILVRAENDIFLAGLDPYGKTYGDVLLKKVQVVGIDLKKKTLGREVAMGYDVLERAKEQD